MTGFSHLGRRVFRKPLRAFGGLLAAVTLPLVVGGPVAVASAGVASPGDIAAFAGNGTSGASGNGSAATLAELASPTGVVSDSNGDVFIADTGNNRIQEVAATSGTQWGVSMTGGDVYTVVGSAAGSSGSSGNGGVATSALLNGPSGIALDAAGDLFVADTGNHRIQEVAASNHTQWGVSMTAGDIYTVAGTGNSGSSGNSGAAASALLHSPGGVSIDASNDLYIADTGNNRIQEVAAYDGTQWGISMTAGDIYTVAGNASGTSGHSGDGGVATSALLLSPDGVASDPSGNLIVADTGNNRVQEVAATSSTVWGTSMTARDIYTIAGSSTGSSGSQGIGGPAAGALLAAPTAVAFAPSGDLEIADSTNNRIDTIAIASGFEWGGAVVANDIYVTVGSSRGASGNSGDGGRAANALLSDPTGVAVDIGGDIVVADLGNTRVREVTPATFTSAQGALGTVVSALGSTSAGHSGDGGQATDGRLSAPWGTATDAAGDVYVADSSNNRIQEIAATAHSQWGTDLQAGDVYTIAGSASGTSGSSGDGAAATSALLSNPQGITVDSLGDLYIADSSNDRVQMVAATTCSSGCPFGISTTIGDVYTVAGSATGTSGLTGNGGSATSALLDLPGGVAVDGAGNLYIADAGNERVQELAATSGTQRGVSMTAGDVYTVAGSATGSAGGGGDSGVATSATMDNPIGIASDSAGNLYVADEGNNRVREVAVATGTQWGHSMTANKIYAIDGNSLGVSGSSGNGGLASSAKLNSPTGVTLDGSGNLYIADQANNRLQEVALSTGSQWSQSMTASHVYTVAGSSSATSGFSGDGGGGTAALFSSVTGVAALPSGAIAITDQSNNQVRELLVNADPPFQIAKGAIETIGGNDALGTSGDNGQSTQSQYKAPNDVAVDDLGNTYVADMNNNRIQEIAASTHSQWGISMVAGNTYTIAGSPTGTSGSSGDLGAATSALLLDPQRVLLDAGGDVLIADSGNNRIQEVAATTHNQWGISMTAGDMYTIAGDSGGTAGHTGNSGAATSALLDAPQGLFLDPIGNLLVSDTGNNRVQFIARLSCSTACPWGLSTVTAADVYTVAGSASGSAGLSGNGGAATSALLDLPEGLTEDAVGNLYIADALNNRIQMVASSACSTSCDWGLASTTADDVYTVVGSSAGTGGSSGDGGSAQSALLSQPYDIAFDVTGDLYVADTANNRIQEVVDGTGSQWGQSLTAGDIYTVVGSASGSTGFAGDGGIATTALLGAPTGVTLDGSGDIYVADLGNSVVREVMSPGQLVTQAGGSAQPSEVAGGSNPSEAFGTPPSTGDGNVAATGASISSSTGELDVNVEDDTIPGRGIQIALDRTYSSTAASQLFSPFGYGWTDSYNMAISADPSSASTEDVYQENGSVTRFVSNGEGSWTAPSRVQATLSQSGGNWIFTRGATTTYTFNSAGQLTSIADLNGNTTTLGYTTYGGVGGPSVLSTVSDPSSRTLTFTYTTVTVGLNSYAFVQSVTDGTRTASYTYDATGNLATVTDVGSGVTTYTYDQQHRLIQIQDPLTRVSKFTYDSVANQVVAETDPMSRTTTWKYGEDTNGTGTTTITDPLLNVTVQTFQSGEIVSETDASGTANAATTTYGYYPNTAGTKVVTDPDGHVWGYVYDQNGNLLRKTNPLGHSSTYAYNALNEQVLATSPLGAATISAYDGKGNLTGTYAPQPDGSTATTADAYTDVSNPGMVTAATDANGKTTSHTYDSYGDLASTTDPVGNETTFTYNSIGEKTSMVSPRGNVGGCGCSSSFTTTYSYDAYGNVTQTTDPLTHSTHATYDAIGDKLTSTDQNGEVTTYAYDADKELSSSFEQGGSCTGTISLCTSYTYDADGNKVSMKDANGQTTTYAYDHLNRLTSTTDPLTHVTSTTYDAAGNKTSSTDQDSDVTHYTYDAANELTAEAEPGGSCTGTVSFCLTYTYDADGNKSGYTDANGDATQYAYDFLDQLTSTTDPMTNVTSYTYDADGHLATTTNPDSKVETDAYYDNGQLHSRTYSDGTTHSVGYTYSPDGQVATMVDGSGTSTYTYDNADRLSSYENGASATVGYGYDSAGNVTTLTYPNSSVVTNHYNALEQLDSVTDWNTKQTQFAYDADGNPTTITYPNNVTSTTAYDNADRLSSITDKLSGTTFMSFSYGRDNAGLINSQTETGTPGAGTVSDGYNALHELTSSGSNSYTFDSANNLTKSPAGQTQAYNADDEPCWSGSTAAACGSPPVGATTYSYSSEGNRTATTPSSGTTYAFGYDEANAMTSLTPSLGAPTTYAYDGNGLLQSETTSGTTTSFSWNPHPGIPLLLADGTENYLYGPGGTPIEQIAVSGGATRYDMADQLGSVRALTDPSGSVKGSFTYDPWGSTTGTSGTETSAFAFAGGYADPVSGLQYFRARWYDAATGQFMSLDPAVNFTFDPYQYVGNDPLNGTDPSGLMSPAAIKAAAAAAAQKAAAAKKAAAAAAKKAATTAKKTLAAGALAGAAGLAALQGQVASGSNAPAAQNGAIGPAIETPTVPTDGSKPESTNTYITPVANPSNRGQGASSGSPTDSGNGNGNHCGILGTCIPPLPPSDILGILALLGLGAGGVIIWTKTRPTGATFS